LVTEVEDENGNPIVKRYRLVLPGTG